MNSQSMDTRKKTGKLLFEIGILIISITVVVGAGVYQAILNNWRVDSNGELFFQAFIQAGNTLRITYLNQQSLYIQVLSVFFSFLGNKEELVLIINLILQIWGIIFIFYGTKINCSYILSLMILFLSIISSIAFYPITIDTPMHFIWASCGFIFCICQLISSQMKGKYFKYLFIGFIIGICCYVDLAAIFLFVSLLFMLMISDGYSIKEKGLQLLGYLLSVIFSYSIMFYLWNNLSFNYQHFLQWINERLSVFSSKTNLYGYISICILLILSVVFSLFKLQLKADADTESELAEEIITSNETATVEKVPENVHTSVDVSINTENNNESDNNIEPEVMKPINFIPNPLPLPKKHVKKEMNYAFEPSSDMMHYDYNNYRFDDDYDLKDIKKRAE